jgi:hypothetical protein
MHYTYYAQYANYIYYIYYFLLIYVSSGRAKAAKFTTPVHAEPIDADMDTDTEGEAVAVPNSARGSSERYNAKGHRVNSNNVISLRHLPLANRIPAKTRDPGTAKFFGGTLNLSKGSTMIALIVFGNKLPIEKHRDITSRLQLLQTVAPFCLSEETLADILKADPEEINALLSGLARNSQQYIRYHLVGNVGNFMADKVLTQKDIHPNEVIKKNLGLIQDHAYKSFMEV